MALRRYGGNVAEVVTVINGDGLLEPADGVSVNSRLFDAASGGNAVQPRNSGGSPISISTDDGGGIPAFYIDDEVVTEAPWFERGGGFPRQQLSQAGAISQDAGDDRYLLVEDLGQPDGPAQLDGSGVLPIAQVPTAAVPTVNLVLASDFTNDTAVNATIGELTIPVEAGDVYFVSACLLYKAAGSTDIKVRIDVPSGSVVVGYGEGYDVAASSGTPTPSRQRYANAITGVSNQLSAPFGGIGTGTVHNPIYLEARVVAGDDGDLSIQAAQQTGPDGANPVTVFAGSYCLFAKVTPPA